MVLSISSVFLIVNPTLQLHLVGAVEERSLLNRGLLAQGYSWFVFFRLICVYCSWSWILLLYWSWCFKTYLDFDLLDKTFYLTYIAGIIFYYSVYMSFFLRCCYRLFLKITQPPSYNICHSSKTKKKKLFRF